MNLTPLALASFALASLFSIPEPTSVEPVTLAWNLQEGASYLVESVSTIETDTITAGQEQEELMTTEQVHLVHVEEVSETGDMQLLITLQSYHMLKESAQLTVELTGDRDEDGEINILVDVESEMEELQGDDVLAVFEAIAQNTMELEFHMLLTPQGIVTESSVDGDPMGDLPTDTDVAQMMVDVASSLLDAEELPGALASQLFSHLSPDAVEVGDEWSVTRVADLGGVHMDGEGNCTLDELKGDVGARHALLTEDLDYAISVDTLEGNMAEMMSKMMGSMGAEMDISVSLAAEDMNSVMSIDFDVRAGFHSSMTWSDILSSVDGSIMVGEMDLDIEVETDTSGSSSWSLIEDE